MDDLFFLDREQQLLKDRDICVKWPTEDAPLLSKPIALYLYGYNLHHAEV